MPNCFHDSRLLTKRREQKKKKNIKKKKFSLHFICYSTQKNRSRYILIFLGGNCDAYLFRFDVLLYVSYPTSYHMHVSGIEFLTKIEIVYLHASVSSSVVGFPICRRRCRYLWISFWQTLFEALRQ